MDLKLRHAREDLVALAAFEVLQGEVRLQDVVAKLVAGGELGPARDAGASGRHAQLMDLLEVGAEQAGPPEGHAAGRASVRVAVTAVPAGDAGPLDLHLGAAQLLLLAPQLRQPGCCGAALPHGLPLLLQFITAALPLLPQELEMALPLLLLALQGGGQGSAVLLLGGDPGRPPPLLEGGRADRRGDPVLLKEGIGGEAPSAGLAGPAGRLHIRGYMGPKRRGAR